MHYHINRHKNYYLIVKNKDFYKCYIYFNQHNLNNYLNKEYKHHSNLSKMKFHIKNILTWNILHNSKDNQYKYYHQHLNCNRYDQDINKNMQNYRDKKEVSLLYYIQYRYWHRYKYHKILSMEHIYQLEENFIIKGICLQSILTYNYEHQDQGNNHLNSLYNLNLFNKHHNSNHMVHILHLRIVC